MGRKQDDSHYVKTAIAIAVGGTLAWIIGGWIQKNMSAVNPNLSLQQRNMNLQPSYYGSYTRIAPPENEYPPTIG